MTNEELLETIRKLVLKKYSEKLQIGEISGADLSEDDLEEIAEDTTVSVKTLKRFFGLIENKQKGGFYGVTLKPLTYFAFQTGYVRISRVPQTTIKSYNYKLKVKEYLRKRFDRGKPQITKMLDEPRYLVKYDKDQITILIEEISKDDMFFTLSVQVGDQEAYQVKIKEPSTAANFEWYFERYISEPWLPGAERIEGEIKGYGQTLFELLFREIDDDSSRHTVITHASDKLTFKIRGDSNGFHSILWETLWVPNQSESLLLRGSRFTRQTFDKPDSEGYAHASSELNLLIVTSRNVWGDDVDYRVIQRPLVKVLDDSPYHIHYHILRPGTFKSFINHMDGIESGFYHMIHFDVHGAIMSYEDLIKERETGRMIFEPKAFGLETFNPRPGFKEIPKFEGMMPFLFFEHDEEKTISPYSAQDLAEKLSKWKVLMVTLNACQSAKTLKDSVHRSLAQTFIEKGVQLVVAMRYTISVSAALIWVESLFSNIATNEYSVEKSASLASRELAYLKTRKANRAYEIDLEDWMLPVLYSNREVKLNLKEWDGKGKPRTIINHLVKPKYGFYGRDHDILRIEKAILSHSIVSLYGMIGVGKTTLLHELRRWWLHTSLFENVIYLSVEGVLNIGKKPLQCLLESIKDSPFDTELTQEVAEEKLFSLLGNPKIRYTVMLDSWSIEDVTELDEDWEALLNALCKLKNTSVIVSARCRMPDSILKLFSTHTSLEIKPLDETAAYRLTAKILIENGKEIEEYLEKEPERFNKFMQLTKYFPVFLEEVIPKLKTYSLEELAEMYFPDYFF